MRAKRGRHTHLRDLRLSGYRCRSGVSLSSTHGFARGAAKASSQDADMAHRCARFGQRRCFSNRPRSMAVIVMRKPEQWLGPRLRAMQRDEIQLCVQCLNVVAALAKMRQGSALGKKASRLRRFSYGQFRQQERLLVPGKTSWRGARLFDIE